MRRRLVLLAPALLAACQPAGPVVTLPQDPALGFADPGRQAIIHAASAFASPAPMAGRPWEAAQAISEVEFLAVDLNASQRWIEMLPLAPMAMVRARAEWRAALGIPAAAEPQAVIDAMTALRQAYAAGDPAAALPRLRPPLFEPGGERLIARLAALPALPRTSEAAQMALREMWRMDQDSQRDDWE